MRKEDLTLVLRIPDRLLDDEAKTTRTREGETWECGEHRLHVSPFSVESMRQSGFEKKVCSIIVDMPPRTAFPFDDLRTMEDIRSVSAFCDVKTMAVFFLEFGIGIENVLCWKKPVGQDENREYYDPDISYLLWIPLWQNHGLQNRDRQAWANRSQVLTSFRPTMYGMSTEKPLDLYENQIALTTKEGDVVLDPMAQGVMVLQACMRQERTCLMMTESPEKADEILDWYEKHTRELVRRCNP